MENKYALECFLKSCAIRPAIRLKQIIILERTNQEQGLSHSLQYRSPTGTFYRKQVEWFKHETRGRT